MSFANLDLQMFHSLAFNCLSYLYSKDVVEKLAIELFITDANPQFCSVEQWFFVPFFTVDGKWSTVKWSYWWIFMWRCLCAAFAWTLVATTHQMPKFIVLLAFYSMLFNLNQCFAFVKLLQPLSPLINI